MLGFLQYRCLTWRSRAGALLSKGPDHRLQPPGQVLLRKVVGGLTGAEPVWLLVPYRLLQALSLDLAESFLCG